MTRITLQTVADKAGVSIATASKALRRREDVSTATRERVMAAVEAVGYVPRTVDSIVASRPSVLVLMDGVRTMYSATILDGIIEGGGAFESEVVVRFVDPDGAAADAALPARCVGAVFVTVASDFMRSFHRAHRGLPVVAIDPNRAAATAMTIGATNWNGARDATTHLLDLGHTAIGWIGGRAADLASAERHEGYLSALTAAGVAPRAEWQVTADYTFEAGRVAAQQLLGRENRPTAIVAANDEIALAVIEVAHRRGLGVPGDLSVVGFDDTPQAIWSTPALTTVHQPLTDMGRLAVSAILGAARGVLPHSRHMQLQTELMVRGTTAMPS